MRFDAIREYFVTYFVTSATSRKRTDFSHKTCMRGFAFNCIILMSRRQRKPNRESHRETTNSAANTHQKCWERPKRYAISEAHRKTLKNRWKSCPDKRTRAHSRCLAITHCENTITDDCNRHFRASNYVVWYRPLLFLPRRFWIWTEMGVVVWGSQLEE